jgi:hypothetical protein
MTTRKLTFVFWMLILLGVGSLSSCASLTTPTACKSVCEVQESDPCKQCIAEDDQRRAEERRKRAEERRNNPPPPSMPSGGGGGGGMGY